MITYAVHVEQALRLQELQHNYNPIKSNRNGRAETQAMEMEIKATIQRLQNSLIIEAAHSVDIPKPHSLAHLLPIFKRTKHIINYVYTGKMLYHLIKIRVPDSYFAPGTVIVAIHTRRRNECSRVVN